MTDLAVLIDTDVFSFFLRRDSRRLAYRDDMRERMLCLSFASVAELRFGAILSGWGDSRRAALEGALRGYVMLGVDAAITQRWAEIKAARQRIGKPVASEDCWIAATALRHDIPLVTHNARDYQGIDGLKLVTRADRAKA